MVFSLTIMKCFGDDSMSLFNDAGLVLKPTCLFGNGDTMQ